jgi:hypothetical protein
MAKDRDEFNDIKSESAVADLTGARHGRVVVVIGKGHFRVRWDDGEEQILQRHQILTRYTTQSSKF